VKITMVHAKPEVATKINLEENGSVIGYIKYREDRESKYHLVIDASSAEGGGLYQGHGNTPERAIDELLDRHENFALAQLRRIEELRKLLEKDADGLGSEVVRLLS